MTELSIDDLTTIRDAVPHLDLVSIRALRRAGFDLVPCAPQEQRATRPLWNSIPRPMATSALTDTTA